MICSKNHKHINSFCNKEELTDDWKESITVPIYKKGDIIDGSNYRHIPFVNYMQNFIQHPAVKISSICSGNYWGSLVWILT